MAYKCNNPTWKTWLFAGLFGGLTVLMNPANAQGKFYRFVNDEGTKVISSTIPPKYVGQGYEVLSANGRVLQVIPPEPAPEDKARVEAERALMAQYKVLARRYSSVRDILSARDRRLAHLDANIAILRSNISNLNSQIEENMSKAANFERAGKKIPGHIFTAIDELRAEMKGSEEVLRARLAEHKSIHEKFADDVALYEQGKKLQASR